MIHSVPRMKGSVIFVCITVGLVWLQPVVSYVIVNRDHVEYITGSPVFGKKDSTTKTDSMPNALRYKMFNNPHNKQLLQLYYLLQVVRSYRRPTYRGSMAIPSDLFERLGMNDLRHELESWLNGVEGFEEVDDIGKYPERDTLKEQLANDFRLLFPLIARTLNELREAGAEDAIAAENMQIKLRDALIDYRVLLDIVVQSANDVLSDIEPQISNEKTVDSVELGDQKLGVRRSKLGNSDAMYEKSMTHEEPSLAVGMDEALDSPGTIVSIDAMSMEKDTEDQIFKAVSVEDPEMAALIPVIIDQLRMGHVTAEENEALAKIFGPLWPLIVGEALRSDKESLK